MEGPPLELNRFAAEAGRDTQIDAEQGEAFVRLLLEHEPMVRSFLRGLLPTWNDVDEVVQEASLVAWRKFSAFEQGTAFGGWFLTIARFEALKHRRRLARTPLVLAEDVCQLLAQDMEEGKSALIRLRHLETCLSKMAVEKRDLLLKVHSPGVVIREVAAQCGQSEQAFYKAIQRMRAALLACVTASIAKEHA